MRLALCLILSPLAVLGLGCASTDITGFRDPAFQSASYHNVVVMARSGDLIRDKATEARFVACLSKHGIIARPSTDLFPPTRQSEAQEILKKLNEEGVGALLFVGLKEKWASVAFDKGTSYSEPREKSAVQLIDAKSGSVAWVASTLGSGNMFADDKAMISSLASKTTAALVKEGLLRPAQDGGRSNVGPPGEAQTAVASRGTGLDQQTILAYLQFASARNSDPNRRVARVLGYLDAHYPYEKTAGVLAVANLLVSNSTVTMTAEQATCWLDDCYRRQSNGEPISDPGVFLANYAPDSAGLRQATAIAEADQSDARQLNRDALVRYLHFAKRQYTDPNLVFARVLGYLDAHYPYQETVNATETFELLIESSGANPTPEDAMFYLNECYKWLCGLPLDNPEKVNPANVGRSADNITADPSVLRPNAYGLGVHQNRYGQPVTLRPNFGGVPGERLQIKENAYGPGVHMDQYGRPVREYSWPDGKPIQ
jgi:hypothetical protein